MTTVVDRQTPDGTAELELEEAGNRPSRAARTQAKQRRKQAGAAILHSVNAPLVGASVLTALASVAWVIPFVLVVEACRELLATHTDLDRVWRLLIIAAIVLLVRGLLYAAALTWSHAVDARFQLSLRQRLALKLTRVPLGWFDEHTSSDVKKYLQDDVEALHYMVAHARLEFVAALVTPLVSLVYLFAVDWRLTLVLLVPLLGYFVVMAKMMGREHRDRMAVYTRSERRVQAATVEFVNGVSVVRAFGQAGKAHEEFAAAVHNQTTALRRWKRPILRLQAVNDILVLPVFVMLVVVAGGLAGVGLDWVEPADIVAFLLVGLGLASALLGLGYGGMALQAAAQATLRLYDLIETAELSTPEVPSRETGPVTGPVRFESVSFGYRQRRVLHNLDCELRPGTITALVGASGSGKSTLAKLLPRFYDVDEGRITIGGTDIREISSEQLYRTVGFVFQDVRMIRGSIRDNLRLGRPDADDAALERVSRAARIHDRIVALPRGYDSEIGVDAALSGGEAQRLSIARALLADTPVLVLDEATAFADPESEAAVQDALAELVAGRTVLVIAHRLHTITAVDQILVLDGGSLVERGTHAQLRVAGGEYQRLWEQNERAAQSLALDTGATNTLGETR